MTASSVLPATRDAAPTDGDAPAHATWTAVCALDEILVDGGVAALVNGRQVAVFRLRSGEVLAIDNHDPCSGANVLARGIVGDVDGHPYVASPLHKHRFDLTAGTCLDEDAVAVTTHHVRVTDDLVEVALG